MTYIKIILNVPFLTKLRSSFVKDDLPCIDIEAVLSSLFVCFYNTLDIHNQFDQWLNWMIDEGLETKNLDQDSKIELMVILKELFKNINKTLINNDLLNDEYFLYQFEKINPDGSLLLTKINHF